jgi:hypothetical protein
MGLDAVWIYQIPMGASADGDFYSTSSGQAQLPNPALVFASTSVPVILGPPQLVFAGILSYTQGDGTVTNVGGWNVMENVTVGSPSMYADNVVEITWAWGISKAGTVDAFLNSAGTAAIQILQ